MKNSTQSWFIWLNSHKKFILWRYLILRFNCIIKVNPCYSTICIYLYLLTFNIMSAKCLFTILIQIKCNLVPTIIKLQWHWALEWFNSSNWLFITWNKCSFDFFVVYDMYLEFEVFIHLNIIICYIFH